MLDADNRPADWTIEIWSAPHAQRPGMNGNSNFIGAEALPNRAGARRSSTTFRTSAAAARPATPIAIYDLPRHRLIHHLLPRVPLRTSSLRGLGAWANVFAIESFIDELAELAGEDPVSYRLSLLSDPRARRVVETAAEMSGWFETAPRREGAARGFGFARYKNIASFAAVVAEVEVDEAVQLKKVWCAADAGLVITPDGARNQIEGGIIMGASFVMKERVRFAGRQGRRRHLGGLSDPALLGGAGDRDPLDRRAERADARTGRSLGRTDRRRDRQRGRARARQAHPRFAIDARAHHGDAAGRITRRGRKA